MENKKILIVDDEKFVRTSLKKELEEDGQMEQQQLSAG